MDGNIRDAESLDQYLDNLLQDKDVLPAEQLDPQTVEMLRKVVTVETRFSAPSAVSQVRIRQAVLDQAPEHIVPARPVLVRSRKIRLAMGLAAAVVVLITAAVMFNGTKPVSAAEILAKAQQVETNPAVFGLQSYRAEITGESHAYSTDTGLNPRPELWKSYQWFQAPDRIRTEYYNDCFCVLGPKSTPTPVPGSQYTLSKGSPDVAFSIMTGSDGTNGWQYDNNERFTWFDVDMIMNSNRWGSIFQATNLETLVDDVGQQAESVKLAGTDTVLNRPVYVLDVTRKYNGSGDFPFHFEQMKIDQETFVKLASKIMDDKGNVFNSWEFVAFDLNPVFDPGLFMFAPPKDAKIIDYRTISDETLLTQSWMDVASKVDVPLYKPSLDLSEFRRTRALYNDSWSIFPHVEQRYYTGKGDFAFVIMEASEQSGAGPNSEKVTVGPYTAFYREELGNRLLTMKINGTELLMIGSLDGISKNELLKVAASLEKVK